MLAERKKRQSGQVLLIVILVIIISLTIGLSLASRSITNVKISTEEADSQKALAAAEAGIEKALQNTVVALTPIPGSIGSSKYETTVISPGGNSFLLNGGSEVTQGEGADVWLADHNPDGSINYATVKSPPAFNIYWGVGEERHCDSADRSRWPAAIEVIVVSGTDATNVTTKRYAYDRCGGRNNNFDSAESAFTIIGIAPNAILFRIRAPQGAATGLQITNGIFVRVIPIYKNAKIGVRACRNGSVVCVDPAIPPLPSQGSQITSTGTSGLASRKISVFKGYSQTFLPYISYGLFVPAK